MLYLKFMILDYVLRLNLVKKKVFLNLFYMQRALCSTREHSSLLISFIDMSYMEKCLKKSLYFDKKNNQI